MGTASVSTGDRCGPFLHSRGACKNLLTAASAPVEGVGLQMDGKVETRQQLY